MSTSTWHPDPVGALTRDVRQLPALPDRLGMAKPTYTTRFVARRLVQQHTRYGLVTDVGPRAGDVVLAKVSHLGQHERIELPDGRRATLFVGDEILVAYGPRYAPDQFEAHVPADLGPTNLAAAGGVAGTVISQHSAMRSPTRLTPIGLLSDEAGIVTLNRCAPFNPVEPPQREVSHRPATIAVLGTSMNAGKSTTAASLVRGLTAGGLTVAAGKVTGTGAGGDPGLFADSGASRVLDFTDFGYPSTYLLPHDAVRALMRALHDELSTTVPDVVVLEVADGLFQRETSALIADACFANLVDAVVFAAGEAFGAVAGLATLRRLGLPVHAVSGMLTASPLATRETSAAVDVPVLTRDQLADPMWARSLVPVGTPSGDRERGQSVPV